MAVHHIGSVGSYWKRWLLHDLLGQLESHVLFLLPVLLQLHRALLGLLDALYMVQIVLFYLEEGNLVHEVVHDIHRCVVPRLAEEEPSLLVVRVPLHVGHLIDLLGQILHHLLVTALFYGI